MAGIAMGLKGSANKSGVGPNRIASGGVGAIKTRVATMETLTPPKQLADPAEMPRMRGGALSRL